MHLLRCMGKGGLGPDLPRSIRLGTDARSGFARDLHARLVDVTPEMVHHRPADRRPFSLQHLRSEHSIAATFAGGLGAGEGWIACVVSGLLNGPETCDDGILDGFVRRLHATVQAGTSLWRRYREWHRGM